MIQCLNNNEFIKLVITYNTNSDEKPYEYSILYYYVGTIMSYDNFLIVINNLFLLLEFTLYLYLTNNFYRFHNKIVSMHDYCSYIIIYYPMCARI